MLQTSDDVPGRKGWSKTVQNRILAGTQRGFGVQVEVQAKYAGYITRQTAEIEKTRQHESTELPSDLDYGAVSGLSNELRGKLEDVRPATIGQASRIPGMTPAAISLLLVHLKKLGMKLAKTA